jgi:hypothetical protein
MGRRTHSNACTSARFSATLVARLASTARMNSTAPVTMRISVPQFSICEGLS